MWYISVMWYILFVLAWLIPEEELVKLPNQIGQMTERGRAHDNWEEWW